MVRFAYAICFVFVAGFAIAPHLLSILGTRVRGLALPAAALTSPIPFRLHSLTPQWLLLLASLLVFLALVYRLWTVARSRHFVLHSTLPGWVHGLVVLSAALLIAGTVLWFTPWFVPISLAALLNPIVLMVNVAFVIPLVLLIVEGHQARSGRRGADDV
jgi:hypothetical protein